MFTLFLIVCANLLTVSILLAVLGKFGLRSEWMKLGTGRRKSRVVSDADRFEAALGDLEERSDTR